MDKLFCVNAVILDGDKVLLCKKKRMGSEYWVLPGGSINQGESVTNACAREAKEETGYAVAIEKLLYLRQGFDVLKKTRRFEVYFLCRTIGGNLSVDDSEGEIAEAKWVSIDSLDGYKLFPEGLRDVLPTDFANSFSKNPKDLGNDEY